ncbi:MAG: hypothetical protein M0D55_01860 [Elusimicrobiota bacterium]|nr:MAG: hypothetical protein M0D55_01860 [Elusimicrobiota bacterium]
MNLTATMGFVLLTGLGFSAETVPTPAPELLRLESALTAKLEERARGAVRPDEYRRFAARFREDLDRAAASAPSTPINRGRYAMILARVDQDGAAQAISGLDAAMRADTDKRELLIAKGSIQLQQGDYKGALASAETVLKYNADHGQPPDPQAAAIRQFSKGRSASIGPGSISASSNAALPALQPQPANQMQQNPFSARSRRISSEVPAIAASDSTLSPSVWIAAKIKNAQESVVQRIDRRAGLKEGERRIALQGASAGAASGAAVGGTVGFVLGGIACSPAIETGGPYLACAAAGGAGGDRRCAPRSVLRGADQRLLAPR